MSDPQGITVLVDKILSTLKVPEEQEDAGRRQVMTILLNNPFMLPTPQREALDKGVETLYRLIKREQEFRFPISADCMVVITASSSILTRAQLKAIAKGMESFSEFFIEPNGDQQ